MSIRMSSTMLLGTILFGLLSACSGAQSITPVPPDLTASKATPTEVQEPVLPSPTARREPTATFEPYTLPLSEDGPYFIGKRGFSFEDTRRDNRPVGISVWYPAIKPAAFADLFLIDAEPDFSGAPYPLILSSAKLAGTFAPHLVSHGFVVIGIRDIDTYKSWDNNMVDQPLDILFALEQVGAKPLAGLEGMIDSDHAGAMGYSFDGYNALAMSGARVDPQHFQSACSDSASGESLQFSYSVRWQCPLINTWAEFSSRAGEAITLSEDGLWQPLTDPRIRAVMPMAPDGWLLFGQEGLTAADRPVLMIVGSTDGLLEEDEYIFRDLGTSDRFLIIFIGQNHNMIYYPEQITHMKHFAAAFFGYYLQGYQEYTEYFSQDFIANYPALAWGGNIGK